MKWNVQKNKILNWFIYEDLTPEEAKWNSAINYCIVYICFHKLRC